MLNIIKDFDTQTDDVTARIEMLIIELSHIQQTVAKLAEDAEDKERNKQSAYYLWDNNTLIQMTHGLMFRVMNELNSTYEELAVLRKQLKKEIDHPA